MSAPSPCGWRWLDSWIFRKRVPSYCTPSEWGPVYDAAALAEARQQALEDAATMLNAEHVARKGADNHAAYYALKVRAMMEKP